MEWLQRMDDDWRCRSDPGRGSRGRELDPGAPGEPCQSGNRVALRVRVLGCHPERRTCSMKRSRSTGVRRLVFRWLLEAIYNQDRCCRLLRLQLQAKLLLN